MFSRLTIALFSLLLIQACAQTQQAREVQSSGFLGTDYARLKEGNEGEALLVYKNANVNLAKYDKIHLDPVTIWMSGKSAFEGISAEDRQKLADDFYNALHKELSQDYRLVDQLGPGVMRIQVAQAEAKVTDGTNGQLLAAAIDRRVGGKSVSGTTDSWDDVHAAFEYWAKQLRYRLCTESGRQGC
jgi:uncharacterized protein DUF3313